MKEIELTQGHVALIDDEDYDLVSQYKWCLWRNRRGVAYAHRGYRDSSGVHTVKMHIIIMGRRPGFVIDHIDRNGLNNQRRNLRFVTVSQNAVNRKVNGNNSSGYRGVYRRGGRWFALISHQMKRYDLGSFDTPEDAAHAWDAAAVALRGSNAKLNFASVVSAPVVPPLHPSLCEPRPSRGDEDPT